MKVTLNTFTRVGQGLILSSLLALAIGCDDGGGSDDNDSEVPQTANGAGVTDTAVAGTGAGVAGGVTPSTGTPTGTDAGASTGTGTGTGTAGGVGTGVGTGTGTPIPTIPGTGLNCEAGWKTYVNANPVGLLLAYKITTENRNGEGTVINSSSSTTETRVVESNENRVVQVTSGTADGLTNTESGESVITKADFIDGCGQVNSLSFGMANVEVLEQKAETISVVAGTFNTNFTKYKASTEAMPGEVIGSSWVLNDGSNIVAKTDVSVTYSIIGATLQSRSITELTQIVRP